MSVSFKLCNCKLLCNPPPPCCSTCSARSCGSSSQLLGEAFWLHRARDSGSSVNGQALVWCLKEKESLQRVTQQPLVLKLVQEMSSAPERDTWVELHCTVADRQWWLVAEKPQQSGEQHALCDSGKEELPFNRKKTSKTRLGWGEPSCSRLLCPGLLLSVPNSVPCLYPQHPSTWGSCCV